MFRASSQNLSLVLGPTNTGKTHLALERMTGYASGMVGFPLRLMARENYDRLVARLGANNVGLLTGEERILPPSARYLCCTVESMPIEPSATVNLPRRRFDFVAVDEVQLAGDRERGHIFTDRIMHARGAFETMLMGAQTAAPLLKALLPDARFELRQRMSQLVYAGSKKLTRLPRRSAVVAFSTSDVYKIAEFVRRQRGGAAVVMGRLSPRTRNAQVDLYQNGDVDFLIATDAIGMGLNLDLGHVALAADIKFDGRNMRKLTPAEMAQIAGRAGRYVKDGTFGVTDGCRALEPEVVEAIEQHRFTPLRSFYWRNRDLNFGSIDMLIESLEAPPPLPFLFRKGDALDHQALIALVGRKDVRAAVQGARDVRLLWDVASIPDFRQSLHESHYDLLAGVYMALVSNGVLAKDTVARAIQQLDRFDGDLDTLMTRLAYIRTWTYITNRSDWTDTPLEWQDRTRFIEDKLSDRLHQRLSERFVDKRTAHLSRKLKETKNLITSVKDDGTVLVEGEEVGQLKGFVFNPTLSDGEEKATILAAARRGLPDEIERRVQAFVASADAAFQIDEKGVVLWREATIAQLVKGESLYLPRANLARSDLLSIDQTQRMQARLSNFLTAHIKAVLGGLITLAALDQVMPSQATDVKTPDAKTTLVEISDAVRKSPFNESSDDNINKDYHEAVAQTAAVALNQSNVPASLSGAAKGIAYMVFERLGSVPTSDVAHLTRNMQETDKPILASLGLRFGVETVYMPEMLKPAQISLRGLLWSLHESAFFDGAPPPAGRVAIDAIADVPDSYWLAIGYRRLGERVMRVDMVERVAMLVRAAAREGKFKINEDMLSLAGATREAMGRMLLDLGCVVVGEEVLEDPAKSTIHIFEKKRKPRGIKNRHQAKSVPRSSDASRRVWAGRANSRSKAKAASSGSRGKRKDTPENVAKPNPDSPFAVLAGLKFRK